MPTAEALEECQQAMHTTLNIQSIVVDLNAHAGLKEASLGKHVVIPQSWMTDTSNDDFMYNRTMLAAMRIANIILDRSSTGHILVEV